MSPLVTAVTMCWGISEQVVTPQTAAVHLCTETQCSNSLAAQMSNPSFDVISASDFRWVFHVSALWVALSPSGRSHLFALIVLVINSPVCVCPSLTHSVFNDSLPHYSLHSPVPLSLLRPYLLSPSRLVFTTFCLLLGRNPQFLPFFSPPELDPHLCIKGSS